MPAKAQDSPVPHPHMKAYFLGETKQIINGQVTQVSAIKSEYNGKTLHVDERHNNQMKHYTIKNKKILNKILENPISNLGLFERLSNDFYTKPPRRTVKHSRSKHRRSIGNHSRSTHSRSIDKHSRSKHSRSKHKHRHSKHNK
jgi:hypothetical protein